MSTPDRRPLLPPPHPPSPPPSMGKCQPDNDCCLPSSCPFNSDASLMALISQIAAADRHDVPWYESQVAVYKCHRGSTIVCVRACVCVFAETGQSGLLYQVKSPRRVGSFVTYPGLVVKDGEQIHGVVVVLTSQRAAGSEEERRHHWVFSPPRPRPIHISVSVFLPVSCNRQHVGVSAVSVPHEFEQLFPCMFVKI